MSAEGVKPSDVNVQKILDTPPPSTYTQIREFIGMANHYRRFIKGFSKICHPLHQYTKRAGAKKKGEPVVLTPEALAVVDMS